MSARATILYGDAQLAMGNTEEALNTWRRVEKTSNFTHGSGRTAPDGWLSGRRTPTGRHQPSKSYLAEAASIDLLEVQSFRPY